MVLLKLLSLPISLPVSGMKFVLQQVADLADQELYDPSVVHEQLLLLHVQMEDGDIDEDEYAQREAELMARLRDIRARINISFRWLLLSAGGGPLSKHRSTNSEL